MFIELLDTLRCPREHPDSWLVASFNRVIDRNVETGALGCPVCGGRYPVSDGVADLRLAPSSEPVPAKPSALDGIGVDELGVRAGAFLGLKNEGDTIALGGGWCAGAELLASRMSLRVAAVNPRSALPASRHIAAILADDLIPLAPGSCAGVALDEGFTTAALASAARALRTGGQIVVPGDWELPAGFAVIARDANLAIGRKIGDLTPLHRASQ